MTNVDAARCNGSDHPDAASPAFPHLPEIDALRGIAALGILIYHILMLLVPRDVSGALLRTTVARVVVADMWCLVDFFFVLSGFIFAHVYLQDDGRLRAGTTARRFVVARIARLYPLHLLTLTAVLVISAVQAPVAGPLASPGVAYDVRHFLLNLVMLQASGLEHHFSFNSPSWSLSVEMLCYLLFFLVARYANGRIGIASCAILGVAVLAQMSPTTGILPVALARGFIGFFVGLLVRRHLAWFMRVDAVLLAAAAIAATIIPATIGWRWPLSAGSQFALGAFPLLLVLCLRGPIPALLRQPPVQLLGDLSFSIYLIHVPLMLLLMALNGGRTFAVGTLPWLIPAFLVACLSLAWLSYHHFERPMRRAVNRLATAKPLAAPGQTAKRPARPALHQ